MSVYRVIVTRTIGFVDAKITESTKWAGNDLQDLNDMFPNSNIYGADPLGHSEIEDGFIRTDYRFEKFVNSTWILIDDPREDPASRPMTSMEKEIDAENRRDFPGDYITKGDYDEYDD